MRALVVTVLFLLLVPAAEAASSSRSSTKNAFSVRSVVRRTISVSRTSSVHSTHARTSTVRTSRSSFSSRSSISRSSVSAATDMAVYAPYAAAVLGDGKPKVLFFHASWCPVCAKNDMTVKAWYPAKSSLPLYKVDYDTATSLRATYGVLVQDTFVKIDGAGRKIAMINDPTIAVLKEFLAR